MDDEGGPDGVEQELEPLQRFLFEQGWPQRITSYDMYGGPGMTVMLAPEPSPEQHAQLVYAFGDTYTFEQVFGTLE